jgi:hypothetical protein
MKCFVIVFLVLTYSATAQQDPVDLRVTALPKVINEYCPGYVLVDVTNNTSDTIRIIEFMNAVNSYALLTGSERSYRGDINFNEGHFQLPPYGTYMIVHGLDAFGDASTICDKHDYLAPDRYHAEFEFKILLSRDARDTLVLKRWIDIEVREVDHPDKESIIEAMSKICVGKKYNLRYGKCHDLINGFKTNPLIRRLYALLDSYARWSNEDAETIIARFKQYIARYPDDGLSYKMVWKIAWQLWKQKKNKGRVTTEMGVFMDDIYDIYSNCDNELLKRYIEKMHMPKFTNMN